MLRARFILIAMLLLGGDVHAQSPSTAPTSQTVVVVAPANTTPETIAQSLNGTELAQLLKGERKITWNDVRNPAFWTDTIKDLTITLAAFIPRLIGTLIFLLVFWLLYRGARRIAVRSMRNKEVDSSIRDMLATLIKWTAAAFGIIIACNQLGIPIVAMLTGVSIIGLAVGFAAQETLANFIAGVVIFLDKPFKVGDWVEIDSVFGQVKRVTFRSTRMLTLDGQFVVFPNTQMLNNKLSNNSAHQFNRVSVPIGIGYKESIAAAREVLLSLVKGDPRIVKDPAPEVIVHECAASSVNLKLRFWIEDESLEHRIGYEFNEKVKNALDAAGIEIPFPHVQVIMPAKS